MKIIGLGNALLDVLMRLESDSTLSEMRVKKGAMDLVDEAQMRSIQEAQAGLPRTEVPGGSVCNTMRSMARLGAEVGYIGKVGSDASGVLYETAMAEAGVKPHLVRTGGISGCCTVLVSPDGERTMCTFLGPAANLTAEEVSDEILLQYDYVYVEGYLISNEKLFIPILRRAKKLGLKVAIDLSNFNIVNSFRGMLHEIVPMYVDALFSNQSEAEAYTGLPAEEALLAILKEVDSAVVTIGKDGALLGAGKDVVHVPAKAAEVVDTTGAGDNFTAGVLYGLIHGASLEGRGEIGALLSSNVIEVMGPQIPNDRWAQIKLKVREILG